MSNKLFLDEKRNILMEHTFHYQLQDVEEPQLYRQFFEYGRVPLITFNQRHVPMNTPRDLWMTDTTFRDGQQARAPYTVKQIIDLFKLMAKLGGPNGMVRQSEFFLYSDKDKEAVDKCLELGLAFPEVTSWIRASEKDFQLVKEREIKETGILVSCSDYHIFKKMNMTRRQAMDKYLKIVKFALEEGIRPRCHFEDITRADFYGFVVPFATELKKLSDESGVQIKIRCCDTLGYGITIPGVSMPRSVPGIIYGIAHYADIDSANLEWHGHNDFYRAVQNATTAWLYGASGVNCSLLGIGERTGNCPLEAMAIEYAALRGTTNGMDLKVITEIAEYYENEIGYKIPSRTPFVGRNFNTTRAGIHADGLLKDLEIYNIFDTEKILGVAPRVVIDEHSGLAGIAYWINSYFELKNDRALDKTHPIVSKLKEAIDKMYVGHRTTTIAEDELVEAIIDIDEEFYKSLVKK